MPLNSLHADICILQIGAVQAERVYIFVQWKFCIGTIKMSITSAYIECTTAKRYHSIELANSFLLKSRYWTFAKITASALWNKFECLALLLCLSIHVLSCIIVWRIETHVHVWLCACVTVHVWLCACVTVCMLTFLPQLILTHGDSVPLSCQQHYLQGTWLIEVCFGAAGAWWSHDFYACLCTRAHDLSKSV